MKTGNAILKLLNVRRNEQKLVQNLFAIEFFQGAGIAFYFTAAFTFFLENFNINELANVFVISAFILIAANLFYIWLEHHIHGKQLGIFLASAMAASVLLFGIGSFFFTGRWFWFLLLIWYYVLYLINNLEFWGIASMLFDVRQSRRLFGVISAGDIPAKFIGYSAASLIVAYIGTVNLIFVGFIFMICSLPFLYHLTQSAYPGIDTVEHHENEKQTTGKMIKLIFNSFSVSSLIETIAILSFLFAVCMFFLNFAFYSEIKLNFHNDIEIARFIALFLAGSRLLAFLLKLIFTARMESLFGYRRTLMLTPVVLGIIIIVLIISKYFAPNDRIIFYIFGTLAILADILRSSIHLPVFLTLIQPLPVPERLRAHSIVKGLMDPLAYLFVGCILLIMIHFFGHIDIIILSYILLGIFILVVISIYKVDKQYIKTLIHSISSRFFNAGEIDVTGEESLRHIKDKLQTGNELEKIYILNLLDKQSLGDEIKGMIVQSLQSDSSLVKSEAIHIISRLHITEAVPFLKEMIASNSDNYIKAEAITALSSMAFNEDELIPLLDHKDKLVRQAAITIMLLNANESGVRKMESRLKKLASSAHAEDRISLARILGEIQNGVYKDFLIPLLNDSDPWVIEAAIISSGKSRHSDLVTQLIKHLSKHESKVIQALEHAGDHAIPSIKAYLLSVDCTEKQSFKVLRLCGRIGSEKAFHLLFELLETCPNKTKEIIKVLYKSNFAAKDILKAKIESMVIEYLYFANEMIKIREQLILKKDEFEILLDSLKIELNDIKELLLHLCSFLYGYEIINRILKGFGTKRKSSIANALELVEITLPKKFSEPFIRIFEFEDLGDYSNGNKQKNNVVIDLQYVFNTILLEEKFSFSSWTKACCLYTGYTSKLFFHKDILKKCMNCDCKMLNEIAHAAIQM